MIVRKFRISSTHTANHRFMTSLSECDSNQDNSLKDIIKPYKIPPDYWKKMLWVAKDLKQNVRENKKKSLNLLETSHVTMLFVKPHGRFQLAFTLACDLLGARKTLYCDSNFENQPKPEDSGRVLSRLTDIVITHGMHHDVLVKLVSHMSIPVFSASSNTYCLQKALSDFMTFQSKLDKLKGLTLAWVGPPNSLFNSYLLLSSKFGIKVRYTCVCSYGAGRMSPVHRYAESEEGTKYEAQEFKKVEETVAGANIIATSMHPEEKHKITYELLKKADPNWVFMHTLPRTPTEVSDEVFNHENNLSWETSENYLYIAMVGERRRGSARTLSHPAIILTSLKNYQPKLKMPCFEDDEPFDPYS